jgi:hypothetical protein
MPHFSQSKRRAPSPQRPLSPRATFICNACQTPEHRRTPALPKNWAKETVGDDIYVYCPDCAIDLPKGQVQ